MKTFRLLTWVTQLALSVAAPLVLCIWGAIRLQAHFQLGRWVILVGILLGIGGAVSGFLNSLHAMAREAKAEEPKEDPSTSYNHHE